MADHARILDRAEAVGELWSMLDRPKLGLRQAVKPGGFVSDLAPDRVGSGRAVVRALLCAALGVTSIGVSCATLTEGLERPA